MDKVEGIDYIVPMVFPDDVLWQRDFGKLSVSYMDGHTRWRSWGTERHLVRMIRKNMPWIRNIYIILAKKSQLQYWMNDEDIKVIYHKDFIPGKYLPTFNSCTIEMFLHKIPGLSEQFIYGNDDMYPLTMMEISDFFVEGKPCQQMKEEGYPAEMNTFQKSCRNGQSFVERIFGLNNRRWLKNGHSLAPLLKSTCEDVWKAGKTEIEYSISPFRMGKNLSQYIYSWWQYYTKEYYDNIHKHVYVNASMVDEEGIRRIIKETEGVLCINDSWGTDDYKSLAKAVRNEFDDILNR